MRLSAQVRRNPFEEVTHIDRLSAAPTVAGTAEETKVKPGLFRYYEKTASQAQNNPLTLGFNRLKMTEQPNFSQSSISIYDLTLRVMRNGAKATEILEREQ